MTAFTAARKGETPVGQVHVPTYLPIAIDAAALSAIAERHQALELALFGSVLRDDFTAASDLDVLITFQPNRPFLRLFELFDMQFALEDLLHRPVDLVPADSLHPLIAQDVLNRKVVIYVATPSATVSHPHAGRLSAH